MDSVYSELYKPRMSETGKRFTFSTGFYLLVLQVLLWFSPIPLGSWYASHDRQWRDEYRTCVVYFGYGLWFSTCIPNLVSLFLYRWQKGTRWSLIGLFFVNALLLGGGAATIMARCSKLNEVRYRAFPIIGDALEDFYLKYQRFPAFHITHGELPEPLEANTLPIETGGIQTPEDLFLDQLGSHCNDPFDDPDRGRSCGHHILVLEAIITSFYDSSVRDRFAYWTTPQGGWVLISRGPDCRFNLDFAQLSAAYSGDAPSPALTLIPFTYDPTNGQFSSGDIFYTDKSYNPITGQNVSE